MTNISQKCLTGIELTATMMGSYTPIGTLLQEPVIIIFDNQSAVAVAISTDGVNTWKTFPAGEALVLDMRGNHGIADNFTFPIGTIFYGNGASGTFSIAYVYAQP